MVTLALVVMAYLIGSLSFAVIVSRAFGLPDPHSYGSGNPGATNVLRTGRKAAALLTLLGDAGKGAVAVLLARYLGPQWGAGPDDVALVAMAVFAGHLWPVFFGFRGGKGVATAAGIFLAVNWALGLGVMATWVIMIAFFRISSLAAIVAALFAPLWCAWLFGTNSMAVAVMAIALLVVLRHRDNIRRLLRGEEGRVGGGKRQAG